MDDPFLQAARAYLGTPTKTKPRGQYDDYIEASSEKYGIDPDLIRAQMKQESGGRANAVSNKGATGLMQLMPATAKGLGVKNINDPRENIEGGVKYMRQLMDMFNGNVDLALAGYNAGEGAVKKYGGKIPPYKETQNYVKSIRGNYTGAGYKQVDPFAASAKEYLAKPKGNPFDEAAAEFLNTGQPVVANTRPNIPTPIGGSIPGSRFTLPEDVGKSQLPPVNPTGVPLKTNATVMPPVAEQPVFKTQAEVDTYNAQVDERNRAEQNAYNVLTGIDELETIGEAAKTGTSGADALKQQEAINNRYKEEKQRDPSLTTERFNQTLKAEQEAKQSKAKTDWLAKNPEFAKWATKEKLDPFDVETQNAYNDAEKANAQIANARKQKAAATQATIAQGQQGFDFTKTGRIDVPSAMGQAPMSFQYDKANQAKLTKGEYRVTDEEGDSYIFTPSTGKFVDEADTQVLETIDLPIPKKGSMTAPVAKRVAGQQIADTIAEKYKLPKQDVIDFFAQYGLSDWETGENFTDDRYFGKVTGFENPLTGGADTASTEPFHLTQRTLNQLEAFSQDRQANKATYEEGKKAALASGSDDYEAEITGRRTAKWMSDKEAEEELAAYKKFQSEEEAARSYLSGINTGKGRVDPTETADVWMQNRKANVLNKYGGFKARQAEEDRIAALPISERITEAARSLLATVPKAIGGISKTMGAIDYAWSQLGMTGYKVDSPSDSPFYQAGTEIWDVLGNWGKNDVANQAWESKVADTIGQVAIAAGSGWATKAMTLPAVVGLSQGASQAMDAAIKDGATPNQQLGMGVVGAVAAMPDILLMKGWFKSFTGQARVGLVKKIGQSVFKQLVLKGATSAEASVIAKMAMNGFVKRAGQLGQKILFNADKDVSLTALGAIGKVAKGAALEGYQEGGPILGENDLNLLGKKFLYKPEITFADIANITDEDIESMMYGAVGGAFGGGIEVATDPSAFKSFKAKRAAYDAINAGMAKHAVTSDGKTFTLGDKTFEVTPELADVITDYQANSRELEQKLKTLADIRVKANKTKDFAAKRELVTEAKKIRDEVGEMSAERATLANQLLSTIPEDVQKAFAQSIVPKPGVQTLDAIEPKLKDNSGNFEPPVKETKPTPTPKEQEAAIIASSEEVAKAEAITVLDKPLSLVHGTSKANADSILRTGKLDPTKGARHYDYSELGPDTVYLAPKESIWFKNPESGRMAKYETELPVTLKEGTKVFAVNSQASYAKLAELAGYSDPLKFQRDWSAAGFGKGFEKETASAVAISDKLRKAGIDVIEFKNDENIVFDNTEELLGKPYEQFGQDELLNRLGTPETKGWKRESISGPQFVVLNADTVDVGQPPIPTAEVAKPDAELEKARRTEIFETAKTALSLPFIEPKALPTKAEQAKAQKAMADKYEFTDVDENGDEFTDTYTGFQRQKELKKRSKSLDTLLKCLNG